MRNADGSLGGSYDVSHVLMTADAVGGVWTYVIDLARALARAEVRTTLAVMGPAPRDGQRAAALQVPGLTLLHREYPLEWEQGVDWNRVDDAGDWLMCVAERVRPDVVHVNSFSAACLPWRVPQVMGLHSDVATWWRAVHGTAPSADYSEYTRRAGDALHRAEMVLAPTEGMLRDARAVYGDFRTGRVIHHGREPGALAPATKRPMIFAAGRIWDESKNFAMLDRAAPQVEWPIYAAGDAGPVGASPRLANLHLLGQLGPTAMGAWYGRTSIFVHPALYEPFGLSILEAAMSGCALVLADLPSLRELWDRAALFVDPRDPDSIARGLNIVASDDEVRNQLAKAALERADNYRTRRMGEETLFAYQDLRQGRLFEASMLGVNLL